jgi:hypothetical protein
MKCLRKVVLLSLLGAIFGAGQTSGIFAQSENLTVLGGWIQWSDAAAAPGGDIEQSVLRSGSCEKGADQNRRFRQPDYRCVHTVVGLTLLDMKCAGPARVPPCRDVRGRLSTVLRSRAHYQLSGDE